MKSISQKIRLLLFVGLLTISTFQIVKADYRNHYVLAVKQKFAIPENVLNGDHIGIWMKTYTWTPTGTISYSIVTNFKNAFAINSSTGLITIKDASVIKNKIVRRDTIINIMIRTSDSDGSEVDTAQIFVKENAYCRFYDYSYRGTETGKRDQPYNDLDDVTLTPGYGYFIKRGNVIYDESTSLSGHKATNANPTLIAAYGTGNKPKFTKGSNICFYLGDTSGGSGDPDATASQYIYFFDLHIRDYNSSAVYSRRKTTNIGFYNLVINNCDKNDVESTIVLNTSSYSDVNSNYYFEVLNCSFDTTSVNCSSGCEKSFIKNGVGPSKITNCRFGFIQGSGYGLRLSFGHGSSVKHCLFDRKLATASQNDAGIQIRQNKVLIENCTFINAGNGVFVTNPGTAGSEAQPDYLRVKNCLFKGQGLNAIHISPVTASDLPGVGHIFEDNYMQNVANGIDLRDCSNAIIRRNTMAGGKNSGISTGGSEPSNGTMIYDNIIHDFGGKEINLTRGSTIKIYNNTVVGNISTAGCSGVNAFNNYAASFESISTLSNNLDIDTIKVLNHFINFTGRDLHLKSTAYSAINHGLKTDLTTDHCGNAISGLPDIGACEYKSTTGDPSTPIVNDPTGTPTTGTPTTGSAKKVYIDPGSKDAVKNGTIDHPFKSWSEVQWVSGNSYFQKRGTVDSTEKIIIGSDDVILGSYGETGELPRISSQTTSYLLSAFEKKNLTITNINIDAPKAASAVYFIGSTNDNITVQRCVIQGVKNGIRIADGQQYSIKYNIINSEQEGIQSSATRSNIFYNVFKTNDVAINIPSKSSEALIYNNVFVGNRESVSVSYANLTLYNNIFYFSASGQKAIKYLADNITSDNNIFYPEQAGFAELKGRAFNSLDELQQNMNLDENSFTEDPGFVDMINNNFRVDKTSPAIDNGKNLNLSEDFFSTKVPFEKTTDIGISEFTGKKSVFDNESDQVKVYPNPSKGPVTLNFEKAAESMSSEPVVQKNPSLKIIDLSGRIIYKNDNLDMVSRIEKVDLSQFANGIYMIVIENLGRKIAKKLVLYH